MAEVEFIPTGPAISDSRDEFLERCQRAHRVQTLIENPAFDGESGAGIIVHFADWIVRVEIGERIDTKKVAMGWVHERPAGTKIGKNDLDLGIWFADPVKFLHDLKDVVQVFQDIVGDDFVKEGSFEWIRKTVEVVNDIGVGVLIDVDADGPGPLFIAAPQVK